MGVLEQVSQMKTKGMKESEIISSLKQQGISPKDINDALGQSQIKQAVSQEPEQDADMDVPLPPQATSEPAHVPKTQEVQEEAYVPQQDFAPQPQQEYFPPQQEQEYAPQPQQEYLPQENYPAENYAYTAAPQTYSSTDSALEIAEQVFLDNIKKTENQVSELKANQTVLQTQVTHALERLKKIEAVMDKLQIAILDKIGAYGDSLETIKKEMNMIESSFSKITGTKKRTTTPKKISKKK